jgi:hypothetical protein
MKKNIGTIDQLIRIVIALVVILLYFADCMSAMLAISLSALIALTAFVNFCPLYKIFRIDTSKKPEDH